MTVTVAPNQDRNTHHLKLSDGVTDVGLILCDRDGNAQPRAFSSDPVVRQSIKMYSGEQRHSDLEPPWTDVAQADFSGGRGMEKFEVDTSRYWDGRHIDTTGTGVILAPMELFDKGTAIKVNNTAWPGYAFDGTNFTRYGYAAHNMTAIQGLAVSFVAPANYTACYIYFWGKRTGAATATGLTVYIAADSGGSPDLTSTTTYTCSIADDLGLVIATNATGVALTSGTTYWLVFKDTSASASNYYTIIANPANLGTEKVSTALLTWAAGTVGTPYYRIEALGADFRGHFAELKGALYCGVEYGTGAVSKVYRCGTSGVATAGATTYVRDSNNAAEITNDLWNGAVIRIFNGTGSHVPSPWRVISDTLTANSEIQVTPNWGVAPDTSSRYIVLGSDRWYEVTGHGLGAGEYISDALGINGAIYYGCGPGRKALRLRHHYASSTYNQWTTESVNFTFFRAIVNAATTTIWGSNRTLPSTIASAAALDCTGTATIASLSFAAAINVGDLGEKVTNMAVYGEDSPILYVFKEGSIHKVLSGVPQELRISGLNACKDDRNGVGAAVNDVYLYFSFLDSIERYYSGALDDIGPNRDGGLPSERRGLATAFAAYPGKLFMAIDGGTKNYSSISVWNGQGWHEIWRAPAAGKRIVGKLWIQPVTGDHVDRLYFCWNGNIIALPVSVKAYHENDMGATEGVQYYAYSPGGSIETAWFHLGLEEINKLFNAVTIVGENLTGTQSRVYLDYKTDDDTSYTAVGQFTISNDRGELVLDDTTHNITGRRIRLRLRLETLYNNSTPKIDAIILEGLATIPSKQKMTITFRIQDYDDTLLKGTPDDIPDADTKLAQLRTWAAAAGTIAMSGHIDELNGLRVKLDYPSIRIIKHEVMEINRKKANRYVCQTGIWIIG